MSAIRRFFNSDDENSIFKFRIDTRNIVAGATNGSENDKRFVLPTYTIRTINAILKVSDGRPDVIITDANHASEKILTFATAGIYDITMVGRATIRFNGSSPDAKKITNVYQFGVGFLFSSYAFENCSNMIWDAPFVRFNELDRVFIGIKGFGANADLSKYIVDSATIARYTFSNIINPMTSALSGFFINLTSAQDFYRSAPISGVSEIKILAPNLTTASGCFWLSGFTGRVVIHSENLTDISNIFRAVTNPPSLGEIDIRRVTSASLFIGLVMSTANVDATLLGWVNNFDWSVIAPVANKVTFDFYNSKYSNNASVIAAKAFLESKGITFTRLTMA